MPARMSRIRFALTTVLVGFGLTLVFWLPLYKGGGFVGGDVYSYYFPQKTYYAERLQAGELPLWNNRTGSGYPLIGESQTGVFYPFHLLLYYTQGVSTAYNIEHLLHYVLAFVFTTFYACKFGLKLVPALFCGLVYTYGWFPSRCCVEWAIIGGAWLPAALWCVESFLQSRRWRYAIGLSLVLTLQMLAGHFQIAFITQLVLVGYVPLRLWFSKDESIGFAALTVWPAVLVLSSAVGLSFALSAVQLLPTWELKRHSQRSSVGKDHDLAFGFIPAWYWSQTITPWRWYAPAPMVNRNEELQQTASAAGTRTNEIEAHLYFGLVPLVLAICAIASAFKGRQRKQFVWIAIGSVAMVYTAGWLLPMTQFVPGFNFFQGPGRFGVVTTLAVAMLAGATLERLLSQNPFLLTSSLLLLFAVTTAGLSTWTLMSDVEFVSKEFFVNVPMTTGLGELNRSAMNTFLLIVFIVAVVAVVCNSAGFARVKDRVRQAGHVLAICTLFAITIADLWLVSRLVTTCWMVADPPIVHLEESPVRRRLAEFPSQVRLFAPAANFPLWRASKRAGSAGRIGG